MSPRASKISTLPAPSGPQPSVDFGPPGIGNWFTHLKSQDISPSASKISAPPAPSGPQPSVDFGANSIETWVGLPELPVVDAPASPVVPLPAPQQLWGARLGKTDIAGLPIPSEPQRVKSRTPHFREKPLAAVLPPCSPKSIYILASLVRQPSTGCIRHGTNASNQARNPAPL